jgi:hypothetical protein
MSGLHDVKPSRAKTSQLYGPSRFRCKRGGRKVVVVPADASPAPERPRVDNAMVKPSPAHSGGASWWRSAPTGPSRSSRLARRSMPPSQPHPSPASARHCRVNARRTAIRGVDPLKSDKATSVDVERAGSALPHPMIRPETTPTWRVSHVIEQATRRQGLAPSNCP